MLRTECGHWRAHIGLAFVVLVICAAIPVAAKESPAAATTTALPDSPTNKTIRELVARLSDDEVRRLFLRDQLERAAVTQDASPAKGMSGMIDEHAASMHTTLGLLEAAFFALPDTFRKAWSSLVGDDNARLTGIAALMAALVVAALIVEWVYRRWTRSFREKLRDTHTSEYVAHVFQLGGGLVLDLGAVAVWGIAAVSTFFLLWHDSDLVRTMLVTLIVCVIMVRTTMVVARLLLAPRTPSKRLLPFADAPARVLYRFAIVASVIYASTFGAIMVLRAAGADDASTDLVALGAVVAGCLFVTWTVWRVRAPIADLIRGEGHGHIRGWLADAWPLIATAYFIGILIARVFDILAGATVLSGLGVLSILLVVALPVVDLALCRALAATDSAGASDRTAPLRSFIAAYQQVFRRAVHIVVVIVGLFIFARLWGLDVFGLAQRSMGSKISSALVGIAIVALLAYITWEAAKTAIDRRLAAEGEYDAESPASRLRTILPLVRALIFVTILVMAIMSMLAALGIDILPLLAGASVVGVAIGFGSQTLVRDVVSGAFFLMDDAFRLGEYIEVGDAKGRVEKINVRTLFLRHHRGALNILPYGEIKRLRNTHRDWVIMVMDFRLVYDTNLATVKKVLKKVGDEIAADEELAPDLLQPLKLGGVMSTEDSAIVVRAKFTARPEGEPWMIRRAAYTKILKAFRENGIKFATRQVIVNVGPPENETIAAAAGAAALATAAAASNPPQR